MSPVEIDISLFWCLAAKGEESSECHRFAKYYRSLCLGEWKDLGLDSLDTVEIVKALEEEFKLEILKLYAVICDPSGPLYFCSQGYAYGQKFFGEMQNMVQELKTLVF
ncbi:hypothetical protein CsSME_00019007 [Camellia sinensis var. sinensis]